MDTQAGHIELLFERAEAYGKTTYELSKLKTLETTTAVATSLVSRLSIFIIFSLFVFLLNIGIALFLGEMLGKPYVGFFIVSAFYLVAGIVCHLFLHHWIKRPISDLIITQSLQ